MHIPTVFLSNYSSNELIRGHCEIEHDNAKIKIELCESDCHTIQNICVAAYEAYRHKVIEGLMNNTPAYVGLPAPQELEEAEFTPIDLDDEVPF